MKKLKFIIINYSYLTTSNDPLILVMKNENFMLVIHILSITIIKYLNFIVYIYSQRPAIYQLVFLSYAEEKIREMKV